MASRPSFQKVPGAFGMHFGIFIATRSLADMPLACDACVSQLLHLFCQSTVQYHQCKPISVKCIGASSSPPWSPPKGMLRVGRNPGSAAIHPIGMQVERLPEVWDELFHTILHSQPIVESLLVCCGFSFRNIPCHLLFISFTTLAASRTIALG